VIWEGPKSPLRIAEKSSQPHVFPISNVVWNKYPVLFPSFNAAALSTHQDQHQVTNTASFFELELLRVRLWLFETHFRLFFPSWFAAFGWQIPPNPGNGGRLQLMMPQLPRGAAAAASAP
jgi:hypothetical protein